MQKLIISLRLKAVISITIYIDRPTPSVRVIVSASSLGPRYIACDNKSDYGNDEVFDYIQLKLIKITNIVNFLFSGIIIA